MAKRTYASVAAMFVDRVALSGPQTAFSFPIPETNSWTSLSWAGLGEDVQKIACGLLALGVTPEERCAILSGTRMDWVLADFAINCTGGATTTIYPSNTPSECAYILVDSETKIVFAENNDQVSKLIQERAQLPNVEKVILFDGQSTHGDWVITLEDLRKQGEAYAAKHPNAFSNAVETINKNHLATLIYTSGTTGRPKGVELTHDCWLAIAEGLDDIGFLSPKDHQFLWLPLSHSFGKLLLAAQLYIGFETSIDGEIPKLVDNLARVQPTFMAAAPRIFEKVYNKVVTGAQAAGGIKYKIFTWAVGVGREVSKLRQRGKQPLGLLALKFKIADKLVFSKLKARFGGRIRFFISGSAPLSLAMAEFFHAADILILEGYGLTESSAGSFVNRPESYTFGTVGQPVGDTEVKIAPEDGEVLMKGRCIMRGYHNNPEATKEALTEDRWLRTGDIGEVNPDGSLKITDRKKDLIKTSGGKYIAPQQLEGKLKALCPYLSQVLVHGNNRNFCTALMTLDEESMLSWKEENGLGGSTYEATAAHPKVIDLVQRAVDMLNGGLAKYETIKKFALLPADFTIESGELTPSMKVKRKAVEAQYLSILDGFYQGAISDIETKV